MRSKRGSLCSAFREAVKDEGKASVDYGRLAVALGESGSADVKNLRVLLEKIAQDEQSHKIALQEVARLVCGFK